MKVVVEEDSGGMAGQKAFVEASNGLQMYVVSRRRKKIVWSEVIKSLEEVIGQAEKDERASGERKWKG